MLVGWFEHVVLLVGGWMDVHVIKTGRTTGPWGGGRGSRGGGGSCAARPPR